MSDSRQAFIQWKTNFLNNFLEFVKTENNVTNLVSLFDEIKQTGKIRDSFGEDVKNFLEAFILPLINVILNTHYEQYENFGIITSLLESLSNFYAFMFKSSYDQFLNAALTLYTSTNAPIYVTSNTSGANYSELYAKVLKPISVPEFCELIKGVIAQNPSYNKIHLILRIEQLLKTTAIYHVYINEVLRSMLPFLIEKSNAQQNILIETPDSKIIGEIYDILCDFATEDEQKGQILLSCININVQFLKSSNPQEQLTGFAMITKVTKTICQNHIQYVSDTVEKTGIIGELCQQCHPDVVIALARFIEMIAPVYRISIDKCNKLWAQTVNSPVNVMFKYVQAWEIIVGIYQQSIRNYLFDSILNGKKYPFPIINFLMKIATTATENNKKTLLDDIMNAAFNCQHEQEQAYKDLVLAYLPKDAETKKGVQRQICDYIKTTGNINLGILLLPDLIASANDEVTHVTISSVLPYIQVEHLPFFAKILGALKGKLTDEEFMNLSDLIEKICKVDMYDIELFLGSLTHAANSPFQSIHRVSLARTLCTHGQKLPNTQLIHALYSGVLINDRGQFLDVIWEAFFRTNDKSFMKYLIDLFAESPDTLKSFIDKCFTNIENVASLTILHKMIHQIEDGVDRQAMKYIPLNQFIPDDEIAGVDLVLGQNAYRMHVPVTMNLYAFKMRVSTLIKVNPFAFTLSSQKGYASVENFNLKEDKFFEVKVWTVLEYKPFIPPFFPSQLIAQESYASKLLAILNKDDPTISPVALEILNLLPTLESQNSLLRAATGPQQWAAFFNTKCRSLMLYRLNTIGSIISGRHNEWIEFFFTSGGVQVLLGIVIFMATKLFNNDDHLSYLLKVVKLIVLQPQWETHKKEMWSAFDSNALTNLIQLCLSNIANNKVIEPLMTIVSHFDIEALKTIPTFIELFNQSIFHDNRIVRTEISSLISTLPPPTQARLLMPLLNFTISKPFDEFFERLTPITDVVENPDPLWDPCIQLLSEYYRLTKSGAQNIPRPAFAQRIFVILDKLSPKYEKLPNAQDLFNFLVESVLFNGRVYYEPTSEVISLITNLFRQNNDLAQVLVSKLEQVEETVLNIPPGAPFLKPTTHPENVTIINLGRTDFMSGIFQNLFNIPQFITFFLSREYTDKSLRELQILFAQMLYSPISFVNPTNFVNYWRSDDGLDVKQLSDASDFYRRLIRTILAVDVDLTTVLRGEIRRTLVSEGQQNQSDRFYSLLPLSILQTDDMKVAIKKYLESKTVNTDKFGPERPALQTDKISKPSKILVIQLQRFRTNEQGFKEKTNKEVKFPLELDISEFMDGQDLLGIDTTNSYELRGVLAHKGFTPDGHYVAYIKKYTDNKWYIYDDSVCFEISEERMFKDCTGGQDISNVYGQLSHIVNYVPSEKEISGYLFFYTQKNWQNEQIPVAASLQTDIANIIKQNIYKDVTASSEYTKLVLAVSDLDINGKFLYRSLVSYCNNENVTESKVAPLIDRFAQLLANRPELPTFVLENFDAVDKYVLNGSTAVARSTFSKVFCLAVEFASPDKRQVFTQKLMDKIQSHPDLLLNYWRTFDNFFYIVQKCVKVDMMNGESYFRTLFEFVNITLPNFAAHYTKESVISSVNVDIIYEILAEIDISDAQKQIFANAVLNKQYIELWLKPRAHSKNFCLFLAKFIGNSQPFVDRLGRIFLTEAQMTALLCASYLTLGFFFEKNIASFFIQYTCQVIDQRGGSTKLEILAEVIERMKFYEMDFSAQFIIGAPAIFNCFLMCKSENVRGLVEVIVGECLPFMRTKEPLTQQQQSDVESLFITLHSMLPDVTTTFRKLRDAYYYREIKRDQFNSYVPCVHYFNLLKNIVVRSSLYDAVLETGNSFIDSLQVINGERIIPNIALQAAFDFFATCIIDANAFFAKNSFTKFIKSIPIFKGNFEEPALMQLLKLVPGTPRGSEKIAQSDCFKSLCKDFMCIELRSFVESRLTPENAKLFAKGLWSIEVIESVSKKKIPDFYILSWEILGKDPNTSSIFFSKENISALFEGIQKLDNPNTRPVMKLFAAFNHAYFSVNKGKKRLGFDKVQSVLDAYLKHAKISLKVLVNGMQLYYPDNYAAGGIPDFLRSMAMMSTDVGNQIFNYILDLEKPIYDIYIPDECIFIARLLVDICSPEFGRTGASQMVLARELASLAKVTTPVGEALELLAERYKRNEQETGDANDEMIKHAADNLMRTCSCVEAVSGSCRQIAVRYALAMPQEKVKAWMDKIYKTASIAVARALVVDAMSNDIAMFYACIDCAEELHNRVSDVEIPKLGVDRNEILEAKATSKNSEKLIFLDRVIHIIGA